MKFDCGKTDAEKIVERKRKNQARYDRLTSWRKVFLWVCPRRMVDANGKETHDCRYMEYVWKRRVVSVWQFEEYGRIDITGSRYKAINS